ncbi:MAG: exodeoxyribonuclease VII large subunit, partial [Sandaracinaceae bacterium]|nr:exodeoxyribonuclease VII large subunit [Sandaracinaceae bacterium]
MTEAPRVPDANVLSVLALNELARGLLERGVPRVWVEGEVTDLVRSAVGHLYFTLGDGRAQVKCVMFRTDVTRVALELAAGARVQVAGGLTLYEPRGSYQLQVTEVIEAGLGARAVRVARLKKKLAAEGLLDPGRKRALPAYPRTVGVVTSRDGAAWRDVVKVAHDRFPARLVLAHAIVQGPDAPEQIVRALHEIQRLRNLSVIILARGGGASEDLAAFDDERVARAVAATRVPIVTGVGHEIDVTLADLCADVRAATPSNAAELAVPSIESVRKHLEAELRALQRAMDRHLDLARMTLERELRALADPRGLLRAPRQRLAASDRAMERAI